MSKAFIAAVDRFVRREQIPLITFTKGQRKDDIAKEYRSRFSKPRGSSSWARPRRRHRSSAPRNAAIPKPVRTYPWIVRTTAMVNHYYFYGIDEDFGPFFLKFCTYFPYNAKLCINGHEYVKRQLAKEGIAFEALDNGILTCANPDGCNNSAMVCRPPRSTRCCGSGWRDCPTRSPPRIAQPAIATTCRSSRPSSR